FMLCRPLRSTLFPYTTLFRSITGGKAREDVLPVLGSREALVQEHDRRLARHATAGVVVRELGLALERARARQTFRHGLGLDRRGDRKSTRLNSSHDQISYAVF